jgi:hypothetical protein
MDFIKKNYEKVILGAVMLGLVGVLGFMPFMIMNEQSRMRDLRTQYFPQRVEPLPALNLSRQQAVLDRLKAPYVLNFSTTNKLFNPVQWVKTADGQLIKVVNGNEIGLGAAVVTKITPLYFAISLNSIITSEAKPRYVIGIEDQAAPQPWQRRARSRYVSKGETQSDKTVAGKDEGFTLVDVKGPPDSPTELDLKLAETQETVPVAKNKPFRRVDGYAADLKYDVEKPAFVATGVRAGDHLTFGGDSCTVIAIDKNEVTLMAQSNGKKFTLRYTP